ncbi:MAG: putative toxin-antitoxin system toxin component, PIN family [Acetobacteraceae bacterium]
MIRAVLDTNVLVSALLSPAGNEALILLAVHHGLIRPCFSEPILEEYALVLGRPRFAFPRDEIEALIAMLQGKGELHYAVAAGVTSPDPGDTKFLDCVMTARVDFLVTGNKRDFPGSP